MLYAWDIAKGLLCIGFLVVLPVIVLFVMMDVTKKWPRRIITDLDTFLLDTAKKLVTSLAIIWAFLYVCLKIAGENPDGNVLLVILGLGALVGAIAIPIVYGR